MIKFVGGSSYGRVSSARVLQSVFPVALTIRANAARESEQSKRRLHATPDINQDRYFPRSLG